MEVLGRVCKARDVWNATITSYDCWSVRRTEQRASDGEDDGGSPDHLPAVADELQFRFERVDEELRVE